ncbi:hypothetical protein LBMAG56_32100 [Verrucomicrobiota bacterium]|nr:hypothetical protein LBMAG56_32100 [Verrucomicrobiota bacterium]
MNYAIANPLGELTLPGPARVAVTVSVIALDEHQRLILHRRGPAAAWGLPGGRLEAGENIAQAALRSFHAATRLTARITYLLGIYSDPLDHMVQDPDDSEMVHEVNILLEARLVSHATPSAPTDAIPPSQNVGFFHPERLPSALVESSVGPLQNYLRGHIGIIR